MLDVEDGQAMPMASASMWWPGPWRPTPRSTFRGARFRRRRFVTKTGHNHAHAERGEQCQRDPVVQLSTRTRRRPSHQPMTGVTPSIATKIQAGRSAFGEPGLRIAAPCPAAAKASVDIARPSAGWTGASWRAVGPWRGHARRHARARWGAVPGSHQAGGNFSRVVGRRGDCSANARQGPDAGGGRACARRPRSAVAHMAHRSQKKLRRLLGRGGLGIGDVAARTRVLAGRSSASSAVGLLPLEEIEAYWRAWVMSSVSLRGGSAPIVLSGCRRIRNSTSF